VDLPIGAVLVAYSDGLVERHDTEMDEQLEVLQRIVTSSCDPANPATAHDIAGEILHTLVPHPELAEDDVCLMVVRREPTA
jgi:serine phosphatase RsbU (regulator of sigma subunit)